MLNVEKIREMKIFSRRIQMEVVKMIAGLGMDIWEVRCLSQICSRCFTVTR